MESKSESNNERLKDLNDILQTVQMFEIAELQRTKLYYLIIDNLFSVYEKKYPNDNDMIRLKNEVLFKIKKSLNI